MHNMPNFEADGLQQPILEQEACSLGLSKIKQQDWKNVSLYDESQF